MKKLALFISILATLAVSAKSEDTLYQQIGPFGGLNNTDNPLIIQTEKAQDLLNVDITPGGKSVKKRAGYAQAYQLTHSSMTGHGVHFFYETGGNDVALFFNDSYAYASIAGVSPVTLFSTGPANATYQCVDSQGYAYCANTSRTSIVKTNGATYSLIQSVISTGTILAVTPTRLVMAGFSEAPGRVDFSQSNDFTNWTPGGYSYSPVNFTVTAPGSKITHLVYAHERVYWFKQTSFGYILEGPTLADWTLRTISPNVGTDDNTSTYRDGILYFRGSDSHIYSYDGSSLMMLTRELEETISLTQKRATNSWQQTTQADFNLGVSSADLSTADSLGSVSAKTTSYVEVASSSLGLNLSDFGSFPYNPNVMYVDSATVSGSIQTIFPDTFDTLRNGSGGTLRVWCSTCCDTTSSVSGGAMSIALNSNGSEYLFNRNDSFISLTRPLVHGTTVTVYLDTPTVVSRMYSFRVFLTSISYPTCFETGLDIAFANQFISIDGTPGDTDILEPHSHPLTYPATAQLYISTGHITVTVNNVFITSSSNFGNSLSANSHLRLGLGGLLYKSTEAIKVTGVAFNPYVFTASSTYNYDTGIIYPVYSTYTAVYSGSGTVTSTSQSSADGTTFNSGVQLSSGHSIISPSQRYLRFNYTFEQTNPAGSPLRFTSYAFSAGSSGTFVSQVNNAPNILTWDSLNGTSQANDGSVTAYVRASTSSFTTLSSTPAWTAHTLGTVPTVTTGTYMQFRSDLIARSSGSVRLDDFTFNWFEGNAEDKPYSVYHKDAIWWSVTSGTGATTNNKILRYDLVNPNTWTIYNIPTNGMYVKNQFLYFVGSSTGVVYKFGQVDNDNGEAINAYWKSKDFIGTSPFVDNEYTNLSLSAAMIANSSMTVTYTINGSSNTSYTMPLRIGNSSFTKFNKNLPLGRTGTYFNIQFGNNAADQPFEVFGAQYGYRPKPWSVTVP